MYEWLLHSDGKYYGTSLKFWHYSGLPGEGFSSLYAVTQEVAKAIEAEGTTSQFKGVVWRPDLVIDADTEEKAKYIETKLKELGYGYSSYTTGNRGLHFYIPREVKPSHLLPLKDKKWVEATFGPAADSSIYTHLHLFRLPGTIHEKTGFRKELREVGKGRILVLPELERKEIHVHTTTRNNDCNVSVFDCKRIMANSVPTLVGDRHRMLRDCCYALRDDAQVNANFAYQWLLEVNKLIEEPKAESAIEQIVKSIYNETV